MADGAGPGPVRSRTEWCKARGLIAPGDRIVALRGSEPDGPAHNQIVVGEID